MSSEASDHASQSNVRPLYCEFFKWFSSVKKLKRNDDTLVHYIKTPYFARNTRAQWLQQIHNFFDLTFQYWIVLKGHFQWRVKKLLYDGIPCKFQATEDEQQSTRCIVDQGKICLAVYALSSHDPVKDRSVLRLYRLLRLLHIRSWRSAQPMIRRMIKCTSHSSCHGTWWQMIFSKHHHSFGRIYTPQ